MLFAVADLAALNYHRQAIHIQPLAEVLCNNLVSQVCRNLQPANDNNGNKMLFFFAFSFFFLFVCFKVLDA